jgi:hypothetical protein
VAFWDGRQWIRPEQQAPTRRPSRSPLRRAFDWALTIAAGLGLLAVALPFGQIEARTPSISLTPGSGVVGETIAVNGSGFAPHTQLQLTWDASATSLPSVISSSRGQFTASFAVPSASPGGHTVAAMEVTSSGGGRSPKSSLAKTLIVAAGFTVYSAIASVSPSNAATPSLSPTASPGVTATPLPTESPGVNATPLPTASPGVTATPLPTATPVLATSTPTSTPTPVASTTPVAVPHLLFGLGQEADGALLSSLVAAAPVHMLTSWFNSHNDLSWMGGWHQSVLQWYAQGYRLHLIIYDTSADTTNQTIYGPACGKSYALSQTAVDDATTLARVFSGGPFYVTVFTEFQTNPCVDNQWVGNENYFRALKDNYLRIESAFHAYGGKVSLGWGGWQTRWDDPATGGGRSMFQYFADVMRASDFESFQAMQGDSNVSDVLAMTQTLGAYGPVMLAHYGPDGGSQTVFNADMATMMTDSYLSKVTAAGLFAWSFMDDQGATATTTEFNFVTSAISRYGL